jgi:RNA polymerase sigma-70 factor (ECF subfamily)
MTNEDLVPDTELAQKAGSGDVQAFGELFQRHNRRVYSLCYRMTGNAADAEDLTQEAFVRLFDKIGTFRGEAEFTTWLHRFTVNQVLMHFRRQKKRPEKTTEDGDVPETFSGPEDTSSRIIINRIALDRAIAELPPGYRMAFVLHDIEGYMHQEIAALLGTTIHTSKSQLHKARLSLRKILKRRRNNDKKKP